MNINPEHNPDQRELIPKVLDRALKISKSISDSQCLVILTDGCGHLKTFSNMDIAEVVLACEATKDVCLGQYINKHKVIKPNEIDPE